MSRGWATCSSPAFVAGGGLAYVVALGVLSKGVERVGCSPPAPPFSTGAGDPPPYDKGGGGHPPCGKGGVPHLVARDWVRRLVAREGVPLRLSRGTIMF